MDRLPRMLIAIGISLWIASPSIAWADCQSVTTVEFVGQVCTDPGRESRRGEWIVDDGGTVVGTSTITSDANGSQQMKKYGKLTPPSVVGDLYRDESKDVTGAQRSSEQLRGRENLTSGGNFVGNTVTYINSDGSQQMKKYGKLTTPSFVGDLYRDEFKDATGAVRSSEQLRGTWIIAPDYKLTGTYIVSVNPDGTMTVTDNRTRLAP